MIVFSAFDGCGIAYQALKDAGIAVRRYYASEVDKYAIKIANKNHPDIIQLGDIRGIGRNSFMSYSKKVTIDGKFQDIDLMIAGSPCQDLSSANPGGKGLRGNRSGLIWEFIRCLIYLKPKYFILENVATMKQSNRDIITNMLGVKPILIDSSLLTAQSRKRYYWTNIPGIKQPLDKGIILQDILQYGEAFKGKSYCLTANYSKMNLKNYENRQGEMVRTKAYALTASYAKYSLRQCAETGFARQTLINVGSIGGTSRSHRVYSPEGKSVSLAATTGGRGAKTGLYLIKDHVRKLTPIECERLQGLPETEKSVIFNICLDHQKNYVHAENKNHKLLSAVGSAEKKQDNQNVQFATKNIITKNPKNKKHVHCDVLIYCEEKLIQLYSQEKLLLSVTTATKNSPFRHLKKTEDFVHLIVGLTTIVEKIVSYGKVEQHRKNNFSVEVKNGKNVVNLYGKEIKKLVKNVEKNLIIHKKLSMYTTSSLSSQEDYEQAIKTLFSSVANAIIGHIPEKIKNQNLLTIELKSKTGYTFGVSNSQRYKMIGNGFTAPVISHILSFMKEVK